MANFYRSVAWVSPLLAAICIPAVFSGPASAQQAPILKMDFSTVNIPNNNTIGVTQVYTQNGISLTPTSVSGTTHRMVFHGSNSNNWVGARSVFPSTTSGLAINTMRITTPGRRFSMKSMRFHGLPSTYISIYGHGGNGGLWNHAFSIGNAPGGNLVTFGQDYANLGELTWNLETQTGGFLNSHHVSEITVALVPVLTMPAAYLVNEAIGSVTVPIGLTTPWDSPVSVQYFIGNGNATRHNDFTLPGGQISGSVTIPAGATRVDLTIPIVNDTAVESPETFEVVLTTPTHGFLLPGGGASAASVITIASDDGVTNFAGWMAAHTLTGNNALTDADPNHDGISNLESWLCRLNPAAPNSETLQARRATWHVTGTNQPALRLTAPHPLPNDVRLIFEETTALSGWSEQTRRSGFATGSFWTGPGASRVMESNTATARTFTFPGSQTLTARPKAFLRLKYELFNAGGND